MKENPNPQGKGLVTVLDNLTSSRPTIAVPPKQVDQIASELFTSMFILESEFQFKPVIGVSYYLYRKISKDGGYLFRLSLVEPERWRNNSFGIFVGECQLQQDITWTLFLGDDALEDEELLHYINNKKQMFDEVLLAAKSLEDVLPVYCENLSFYRRAFASGLASSLGLSMALSGIKSLTYDEAESKRIGGVLE